MKVLQIVFCFLILAAMPSVYANHCGTSHDADNVRVADKDQKDNEEHQEHDKEGSDSDHQEDEGHNH